MGRAYEVRKASIQKTGAAKAKLYSMYAKEIYQSAKIGGTDVSANVSLKRLIDKAKKEQVPSDIINRAIEKVNNGADESYQSVRYELFGPSSSTLLVDCLTDNVNRSISSVRTAINKTKCKMGVSGSASFMYDNLCVVGFKGFSEEEVLNALINKNIDVKDIEDDDMVVVYGLPSDLYKIKEAILSLGKVDFEIDEIVMLPKEKVTLSGIEKEDFTRLLGMLDEIEDVQDVYHNVNL